MNIVLGCVGYIFLLAMVRHAWPEGILFYQGITLAIIAAALQWLIARLAGFSTTPGKDAAITLLATYAFMFTIPTTVDRAYSVRLLVQLEMHPQGMMRVELEDWFAKEFASGGVDRRLQEQIATGSVEERGGRYGLTEGGRHLARTFAVIQRLFVTHSTNN